MAERRTSFSNDFYLIGGVLVVLIMLLVPLPPILVDLFVSFNFTLSVLILLVTMYVQTALQFSVFPTFLLIVTLFRLALGILVTRSLLLTANAGSIVQTFGQFVVGGNYIVGIVIFTVLVIIQFVVITGGAQRVAEVAARFTLDAMPGKQMSIDADLNAGIIDEATAKQKRIDIAREADFYGAMDGATKFIRGDAIAAIIIIIVNILGGFIIGMLQLGMTIMQALQTYTLLTVGAGIVLQIPALLISSATGIIVTKAASDKSLAEDLGKQLFSHQRVMYVSSGLSFFAAFIPGMPIIQFLLLSGLFGYLGYNINNVKQKEMEVLAKEEQQKKQEAAPPPEKIIPALQSDVMEMEIGYGMIPMVDPKQGGSLLDNITSMRKKMASELGIVVPPIRIRDNISLKPNNYVIKIKGAEVARGELMIDRYLAMNPGNVTERISGFDTVEPTFGLPALWITEADKERAQISGYTVVDAASVIITHITEVIRTHAADLLGRQEVKLLLDNVKKQYPTVVDELTPTLMGLGDIQKVLHNLLKERIPIRNLVTILEILADNAKVNKNIDALTSYCRQGLARVITKMYQTPKGVIAAITLDPTLEQKIADSIQYTDQGAFTSLDPVFIQKMFTLLLEETDKITNLGYQPIIVCSSSVRPHFKKLTTRSFPNLIVLAYNEIVSDVEIQALGLVRMPDEN
ncbi:MAG: flagellar biosynthesis protein FlhA [Candidatus Margulisbacteria bacterium]|nr:flagellar biosynthesis protein FlhA [Candidatus Margulisiibacteriota bacterium]